MKFAMVSCEVFYREVNYAIKKTGSQVDVHFMPKGLHDLGCKLMQERLKDVVESINETQYDAILLGYGLCNNGVCSIQARNIPVVIPRAHDCITLFMGSKEKYSQYFNSNPGTYFWTSGWLERGENIDDISQISVQKKTGLDLTYEQMVEQYGEDNADYLFQMLGHQEKNYGQYAFIEMGVEPDDRFEKQAQKRAEERGWNFEKVQGDMDLICRFIAGDWKDEDFQIIKPGFKLNASFKPDQILQADIIK